MTLEEAMKLTDVELIDMKRAGCVVIRMTEDVPRSYLHEVAKTAKKWADGLGVNVLLLPHNMDINIIPHDLVTKPLAYKMLEDMEQDIQKLKQKLDL